VAVLKRDLRVSGDDMAPPSAAMPPQEGGRRAALGRRSRFGPRTAAALAAAERPRAPPHNAGNLHGRLERAWSTGSTTRSSRRESVKLSLSKGLYVAACVWVFQPYHSRMDYME